MKRPGKTVKFLDIRHSRNTREATKGAQVLMSSLSFESIILA